MTKGAKKAVETRAEPRKKAVRPVVEESPTQMEIL